MGHNSISICLCQADLKSFIAHSSVSHIALVIIAILIQTPWSYIGDTALIIALTSSILFCLENSNYMWIHSWTIILAWGLPKFLPLIATWWLCLLFSHSSCVWIFVIPWTIACLLCPSLSPRVCSNSCPLSRWYNPTISSSVVPFSSCPQSSQASGSFPMCQFFTSGGQSIGASTSTSVLPMGIQGWFPLGLTGLISLHPRDSQESSSTPQFESINSLVLSFLYGPTLTSIQDY